MFLEREKWEPTITFTEPKCKKVKWKSGKPVANQNEQKTEAPKSEELLLPYSKNRLGRKKFLDTFKQLIYAHRPWDVWRDLIIMNACAISNAVDKTHYDEREKRYLSIIKKYTKVEQKLFPELCAYITMALEDNPEQDFLGKIFMALGLEIHQMGSSLHRILYVNLCPK